MDNIIIRLDSKNANEVSYDEKTFTYYFNQPFNLTEEYVLQLKQFQIDALLETNPAVNVVLGNNIKSLYIDDADNDGWGQTSLGIYKLYSSEGVGGGDTCLTFEIYEVNPNGLRKARLLWVTANYLYNMPSDLAGHYVIYSNGGTGIGGAAPNGELLHTTLLNNFYWYKTTTFYINSTGRVPLYTPLTGRKYKLYVNHINFNYSDYFNSDRNKPLGTLVNYNEQSCGVQIDIQEKYLLTLPPQTLNKISVSLEDNNDFGINLPPPKPLQFMFSPNDNFALCFLLTKKNKYKK